MSKSSRNKILASALTASLVVVAGAPEASANNSGFTDVSSNYSEAVDFLYKHAITTGISPNTFGTYNEIKRSDAAVIIARSLGLSSYDSFEDAGFEDVPLRAIWAVNLLAERGIIQGMNATEFGSDEPLTRNQMAKIIANAGQLEIDETSKTTRFKDVNSNFAPYVEALVQSGITKGKSKDTFGADDFVTRGEMAVFINRSQTHFGFMDLLIMHLNDTHAYLDKFPYIATAVNEHRKEHENHVLLHAGDVFSGDLYFNAFKGEADLALMNHLGFDAMTFGNHEFDLGGSEEGHKALANFVNVAEFPLLGANVDFSKDPLFNGMQTKEVVKDYENGHIYNGVVLDVNRQKVGVFGLTTEETPTISSTGEIDFSNYIEEAKKSVKAFEDLGINKIIALTHLGYDDSLKFDNDLELAKQVEGIDVIVGGHTHSELLEPHTVIHHNAPTVIVQAKDYGKALGTLNVSFNQYGWVSSVAGELINTDHTDSYNPTTLAPDQETFELLAPYAAKVFKLKQESIGKESLVTLDGRRAHETDNVSSVRFNETNLGNLMTDAMLAKAQEIEPKTSIALQNGGGIRATIPAGDLTIGNILTAMPFGNALAIAEVSGADLLEILEHGVSADEREGGGLSENGAFLHVAGMQYSYDSSEEKGNRIKSVKVKKDDKYVDLVEDEMYFVATNNFTAKGGDDFKKFAEAYADGRVSEPGFVDYENFIDYLQTLDTIEPQIEGRIIDLALTELEK